MPQKEEIGKGSQGRQCFIVLFFLRQSLHMCSMGLGSCAMGAMGTSENNLPEFVLSSSDVDSRNQTLVIR